MAYQRGTGTLAVEVVRLQSWVETADPDLYGTDGEDIGVIREHHAYMTERKTTEKFIRWAITIMGVLGGIPALIVILQLLHIIPR